MVQLNDFREGLPDFLKRVEAGEAFVIVVHGRPVAEIKPVSENPVPPRPYGLCAGEFITPDDFDSPLPNEIIEQYKATA